MSMDAMEVDRVSPPASERKRKNKENDGHASKKKRKHHEDSAAQVDASPSKDKKKDKKSKHKHRKSPEAEDTTRIGEVDAQLSKKQKKKHHKHDDQEQQDDDASTLQAQSPLATRKPLSNASAPQLGSESHDSPFHLVTSTLYLPLSPISISPTHALSSLLAEHVSPLLLTYYPPFRGLILAYSNPSISSTPPSSGRTTSDTQDNPQPLTLAVTANEYGVLYVYLTATFLVFRPERGQTLEGWINVQSDGFLGAVVHNLFSVGIERRRLPQDWEWVAPGQEESSNNNTGAGTTSNNSPTTPGTNVDEETDFDSDKENFRPLPASSSAALGLGLDLNDPAQQQENQALEDEESAATGYFRTRSGRRVRGTIRFRVRDIDVIPGAERDKGFLSIEGTMLSPEEEAKLVAEERNMAMGLTGRGHSGSRDVRMSGAVGGGVVNIDAGEGGADPEVAEILPEGTTATTKKKKDKKSRKSTS